jgi:hypothetical protein
MIKIDPLLYKEIGIKKYWWNNNIENWKNPITILGLKPEENFGQTKIKLRQF